MKRAACFLVALFLVFGMLMSAAGCRGYYGAGYGYEPAPPPGPPPWAPAHGYRAKHRYHYYPDARIYFDIERRIYFYYSDGYWRSASTLPVTIVISGTYVLLEMDDDKPYKWHKEVEKRYPPGKMRQEEGRGKGKGK